MDVHDYLWLTGVVRKRPAMRLDADSREKPPLTDRQKCLRLKFARAVKDWGAEECGKVVFSDECTFSTTWDQQRRELLGWAVSGPSPSPSPTETALQQQIGELRRQNRILARKIQELEAKQVGSSEPVQEAEADEGDDGSSVTSRLTSVSRQDEDTVVGSASITEPIGRLESLEGKTEQLEARVAAFPTQIMSAVRESFQDMFMAALTQPLPDIVAQVSNSVLKAVQPWVSTQIKNTTQCDAPQLKRKPAFGQAAEESFSGSAPDGPVRLLTAAAQAPGPHRSPAP
ncbi:hypothetical protein HPB50_014140 [Hyalomma asiaticum]|uniref:Uncharacterized protein n=1 Tax=Hyalomma asiaticum TaxID=266040 RepID=A0ACB7RPD4_HYAAI|nr:hypothetical protein HPB50_014140 [Hyalomma asiaticum]